MSKLMKKNHLWEENNKENDNQMKQMHNYMPPRSKCASADLTLDVMSTNQLWTGFGRNPAARGSK